MYTNVEEEYISYLVTRHKVTGDGIEPYLL